MGLKKSGGIELYLRRAEAGGNDGTGGLVDVILIVYFVWNPKEILTDDVNEGTVVVYNQEVIPRSLNLRIPWMNEWMNDEWEWMNVSNCLVCSLKNKKGLNQSRTFNRLKSIYLGCLGLREHARGSFFTWELSRVVERGCEKERLIICFIIQVL